MKMGAGEVHAPHCPIHMRMHCYMHDMDMGQEWYSFDGNMSVVSIQINHK